MEREKRKGPYVGITGFMSAEEVATVLANTNLSQSEKLLMVGVLGSLKTMKDLPNKWPNRYPKKDEISQIFLDDPRCLNLVHYATGEKESLADQLFQMVEIAGPNLHGFQLNVNWPDPKALDAFKNRYPEKVIVFAASKNVFESVNNSPVELAARMKSEYEGLADYILLDPSGGHGIPFDADIARGYLEAFSKYESIFTLGAAGGLGPDTLDLVRPLIGDFPNLCIDAEGRLRTAQPEDRLNIIQATSYVRQSLNMFAVMS